MIKIIKRYSNFNPPVIIGSLSIVLGLSLFALLIPQISQTILQGIRDIIFEDFSWFYVLSISLFFIFNIFL
ncbi:BCCT family transporter [Veillonella parvula]|uniref:BCCT family transporter n=1 Tax=Veillonella parvula TaxID=29466 RepID=UPI00210C7DE5|nr:BCCT family transporter [Veillonella parvula]MCQ4978322.1 BCCT family transporter [Veillonella parvula]